MVDKKRFATFAIISLANQAGIWKSDKGTGKLIAKIMATPATLSEIKRAMSIGLKELSADRNQFKNIGAGVTKRFLMRWESWITEARSSPIQHLELKSNEDEDGCPDERDDAPDFDDNDDQ